MSGTTSERVASQGAHDQLLIVAQAGDYERTPPSHGVTSERPDELSSAAYARNDAGTERSRTGQARVSSLTRGDTDDDRTVLTAYCALIEAPETAQVRDYIRRVVDAAPPLTKEQHDKLAMLLRRSRR